ncbi:hypothetical protein PIB30_020522 [Stylosanthes scabra]|uniref:Uncharacterized protein n=1 Tax=Stylosanthes scabra TaxID=79078 RepID=A0ABU6Y5S5_9FABA|nr:hypothetical protein [Stylosanthes scabra]
MDGLPDEYEGFITSVMSRHTSFTIHEAENFLVAYDNRMTKKAQQVAVTHCTSKFGIHSIIWQRKFRWKICKRSRWKSWPWRKNSAESPTMPIGTKAVLLQGRTRGGLYTFDTLQVPKNGLITTPSIDLQNSVISTNPSVLSTTLNKNAIASVFTDSCNKNHTSSSIIANDINPAVSSAHNMTP